MKNRTPMLENFSLGLFVGVIFAIMIAALFDSDVAEGVKSNWVNLAAIVAAIFAAYLALLGVRRQIEHQSKQSEAARLASLAATKAFLPIVLSEMCKIATAGMNHRWNFHSTISAASSGAKIHEFQRQSTRELELSDQVISVFRDFIENANPNDGKRVAMILRGYQVLLARWHGVFENPRSARDPSETIHETTYWAYLYALSSSVFEFSRDEADNISTTVDVNEIKAALSFPAIYYKDTDGFDTQIDLYGRKFQRQI